MGEKCPFSYYEEIAESSEARFCKLDDKICIENNCTVLKAIRDKQGSIALKDSKNFNKGQFLGSYRG